MTELVSPHGWVPFQIYFPEEILTQTNLLHLQRLRILPREKMVPIYLPANPMQQTPELSNLLLSHTDFPGAQRQQKFVHSSFQGGLKLWVES